MREDGSPTVVSARLGTCRTARCGTYIDGTSYPLYGQSIDTMVQVVDIGAIEVYPGGATVPPSSVVARAPAVSSRSGRARVRGSSSICSAWTVARHLARRVDPHRSTTPGESDALPITVRSFRAVRARRARAGARLAAQTGGMPPRSIMVADWERQKKNVLAYIDVMPDSAITFAPTPGVRNFAQQIEHFAGTNTEVAAVALKGLKAPPSLGDTATYLHKKAALRDYTVEVVRLPAGCAQGGDAGAALEDVSRCTISPRRRRGDGSSSRRSTRCGRSVSSFRTCG